MNKIYRKLIDTRIEDFKNNYVNVSRQVFINSNGELYHPSEFGVYREKIVSNFLEPVLPSRLSVGSGFIITNKGRISTQCDVIVYDRFNTPKIENNGIRFFPVETVVGIIEVKSILNKNNLKEALIKLANNKSLRNDIDSNAAIQNDRTKRVNECNTKLNVQDQVVTMLICERVDFDLENELTDFMSDTYKDINKSLYHNMILCLDDKCLLYQAKKKICYPYIQYDSDLLKNSIVKDTNKINEHILLFLDYFCMAVTSVSTFYVDFTNYLF